MFGTLSNAIGLGFVRLSARTRTLVGALTDGYLRASDKRGALLGPSFMGATLLHATYNVYCVSVWMYRGGLEPTNSLNGASMARKRNGY